MSERLVRLDADQRFARLWALGSVLHDASRELHIAAKQDWHRLMTPKLERAREIYEAFVAPCEPLSDISGWHGGGPFHVTREDLRAVWRERRPA